GGHDERDAYRVTVAELNDLYPLQASMRPSQRLPRQEPPHVGDSGTGPFFEGLWKDFRYALRSMRNNPVFTLFVVLTLSLGIGANATVFTLINTLVLNPLPARNPSELAGLAAAETQ